MFHVRPILAAITLAIVLATKASAEAIPASPEDVAKKVAQLMPDDILELEAGIYAGGLAVYELTGTASQPITIRGPVNGPRAVFEGTTGTNVIRIRNSSYVSIENLEIKGMGREGDGVKAEGRNCSHHITIENLYIHDLEQNQQVVGISTNGCGGSSWDWTIRGNRIERVGTGMYLGSS